MIEVTQVAPLRQQIQQWKQAGLRVGFVPTMGNLHRGHLSLVEQAQALTDKVVVSVFVNPLQFAAGEDFETYPRTLEQDRAKLTAQGCDLLFAPVVDELYPKGEIATRVCAPVLLDQCWEGATRPGHFDGVCTVVAKLFNLVQPDLAVFGQKDYQQWRVLQTMVAELNWPIKMVMAPIARDDDGLALSSRNQYLSVKQRQIAPKLFVVLQDIAMAIKSGNRDFRRLEQQATQQCLAEGFDQVDYIAIVDPESLILLTEDKQKMTLIAVARLGSTRLLDNIELDLS